MYTSLEFAPFILSILAALSWGTSDFFGGIASKRNAAQNVVWSSQLFGLGILYISAILTKEKLPPAHDLLLGAFAGLSGAIGLISLYSGLATQKMGFVAPVAAVIGTALPFIVAGSTEGLPPPEKLNGFFIGILAVWMLSSEGKALQFKWQSLIMPALAGLGFGGFFVLVDQFQSGAVYWPLVSARVTSISLLLLLNQFQNNSATKILGWGAIAIAGVFDAGGNIFITLATQTGRVDFVALLSSFAPAITVLLALIILKERLTIAQWLGVTFALLAIIILGN